MAQAIGFKTAPRQATAALKKGSGQTSIDLATRKITMFFDDGTSKELTYDNPFFGNSGNTLYVAKTPNNGLIAAVNIEFKPGLVADGVDTRDFPPSTYTTPSGITVTIPYGAVVTVAGGYHKPGDADSLEESKRELYEEMGLEAKEVFFLGRHILKPAWANAYDDTYLMIGEKTDFSPTTDVSIGKRLWLPFADIFWLMGRLKGFGQAGEAVNATAGAHYPAATAVRESAWALAQKDLLSTESLVKYA